MDGTCLIKSHQRHGFTTLLEFLTLLHGSAACIPVTASFAAVPQAKNLIKQQIADDRKARQSRGKPPATGTASGWANVAGGGEEVGKEKTAGASGAKSHASSSSTCRLQVYSVHSI